MDRVYFNPVEVIRNAYQQRVAVRRPMPAGKVYASSIGYGARRLAASYRPDLYPPDELTDRAARVFEFGDMISNGLRKGLHAVWPTVPERDEDEFRWEIPIVQSGGPVEATPEEAAHGLDALDWVIVGKDDGFLHFIEIEGQKIDRATLEIKSMADHAFKRFQGGEMSANYHGQIQIGMAFHQVGHNVLIAENKVNGQLKGRLFHADADHQRDLVQKARQVAFCTTLKKDPIEAFPVCPGKDYGVIDETDLPASGKLSWPKRMGDLRWGCSYCPYWKACWPTYVRVACGDSKKQAVRCQSQLTGKEEVLDGQTSED